MTTKPTPSSIGELIDAFVLNTGDSPTHILVTADQWHAMNQPKVFEHSLTCLLDYLIVGVVGEYHYPQFPMVVQLPQYPHTKTLFGIGKVKLVRET